MKFQCGREQGITFSCTVEGLLAGEWKKVTGLRMAFKPPLQGNEMVALVLNALAEKAWVTYSPVLLSP